MKEVSRIAKYARQNLIEQYVFQGLYGQTHEEFELIAWGQVVTMIAVHSLLVSDQQPFQDGIVQIFGAFLGFNAWLAGHHLWLSRANRTENYIRQLQTTQTIEPESLM